MSEILSSNQVMERYQITAKALCSWKSRLSMPYLAFGREHRYRLSELEEWESAHHVPREIAKTNSRRTILPVDMVLPSKQKGRQG